MENKLSEIKKKMLRAKYKILLERGLVELNGKMYEEGKKGLEQLK